MADTPKPRLKSSAAMGTANGSDYRGLYGVTQPVLPTFLCSSVPVTFYLRAT